VRGSRSISLSIITACTAPGAGATLQALRLRPCYPPAPESHINHLSVRSNHTVGRSGA